MANHKSAEKRARQSLRKQTRNSSAKSGVRTHEKKIRTALAASDKQGATESMQTFVSKAMKAAAKGVIPKKTAARKIGRLAARLHKLAQKGA